MYYQTRTRADKPFPVTDDFFAPLQLTTQRLAELRAEADSALRHALSQCTTYQENRGSYLVDAAPWRLHVEHDGLTQYKRPHPLKTKPTASLSQLFGTVEGDYLDLIRFFQSETREQYYNTQKTLFPFTIDAAVLHNVAKRDQRPRTTSESVKWAAYEPFSLRFRLDAVHYECTGTGVDANCKPFAYRIVIPATFAQVPDFFKSKRSVRTFAKSVMLAMPSERTNGAYSELFMTMESDFKSNSVPRSLYKRYMASLHKISSYVDNRSSSSSSSSRFVLTRGALALEWTTAHSRDECSVCMRSFSLLRSKHKCAVCAEVVCRKCTVRASRLAEYMSGHTVESSVSRFCKPCVKALRDEHADDAQEMPILGEDCEKGNSSTSNHSHASASSPWVKSPRRPHEQRLSETPTEASASDASLSYVTSSYSSSGGSTVGSSYRHSSDMNGGRADSSQPEWVTTPKSKSKSKQQRSSGVATTASEQSHGKTYVIYQAESSTSSVPVATTTTSAATRSRSSSFASDYSSSSSASSSFVEDMEEHELVDYYYNQQHPTQQTTSIDITTPIYEDETESSRSNVLFTIDTSEMTRVRSAQASPTGIRATTTTTSRSTFDSISHSLQEQELLLRQLHLHAACSRSRADTQSMGVRASASASSSYELATGFP